MAEATLVSAAAETKNRSAGTALLSLKRLGENDPRLAEKARELAVEAAADENATPDRTLSAIAVASEGGDKSVLPKARKVAADAKALIRYRMSCIAAIGKLGETSDIPLLMELSQEKESRISRAASTQLRELKRRLKIK